jgi:hypothetical protein
MKTTPKAEFQAPGAIGSGDAHQASADQASADQAPQPARTPTLPHTSVFDWRDEHAARIVRKQSTARIGSAVSGIHALSAILMQREVDTDCEGENLMVFDSTIACGIVDAIACCAELIGYAMEDTVFTTGIEEDSPQEAQLRALEREAARAHNAKLNAMRAQWGQP